MALVICLTMFRLWAQGNYYIYIQSDNGRAFYAKSGTKVFESSGNGYLLIPELSGDVSELTIGFPDQPGTEWKFSCNTGNNDQAYILRAGNSKSVELSILKQGKNIEGTKLTIEPPKHIIEQQKKATGIVSDDPFSTILAQVVSDPTIRQRPVIIPKPGDSLNIAKNVIKDSLKTSIAAVDKQPEVKKEEKLQPKADSSALVKDIKKDSAKSAVAVVNKPPEVKKEDKPKSDSSVTAKDGIKDLADALIASSKKDSAKTAVTIVEKQPELKKEDNKPQPKADNGAIVKDIKKDSAKAAVAVANKPPEVKKEDKLQPKADSSTIVKDLADALIASSKKDSAKTAVTIVEKQPEAKKEDNKPQPKADNGTIVKDIKKDSAKAAVAVANKPPEVKKEDKPKPDSGAAAKDGIKDLADALIASSKKDSAAIAKTNTSVAKQDANTAKTVTPATSNTQTGGWVPVEKKLSLVVRSSNIKRTLQRKSNEGIELIYIDELSDGSKDTIRILIPAAN